MQNGANSLEGCLAIPLKLNRNLQYFTVHSTLYILAIPFLAIHPPKNMIIQDLLIYSNIHIVSIHNNQKLERN